MKPQRISSIIIKIYHMIWSHLCQNLFALKGQKYFYLVSESKKVVALWGRVNHNRVQHLLRREEIFILQEEEDN